MDRWYIISSTIIYWIIIVVIVVTIDGLETFLPASQLLIGDAEFVSPSQFFVGW